jgi:excisionase family DNA binding protein
MTDKAVIAEPGVPQMRDVDAVARRLNVSPKTVRRMINRGELPVHRIGKLVRISDDDLVEYVRSSRSA